MTFIDFKKQQFHLEECSAMALAEQYGTPLYVYSKAQLLDNWQRFTRYWPAPHRLCYAVKANSHLAILQLRPPWAASDRKMARLLFALTA